MNQHSGTDSWVALTQFNAPPNVNSEIDDGSVAHTRNGCRDEIMNERAANDQYWKKDIKKCSKW
jgi:hypothetical protein